MTRHLLLFLPLLASCAATVGSFTGESATYGGDNILRDDVTRVIRQWERSVNGCTKIDVVDAKVIRAQKVNGRFWIEEDWKVTACGKSTRYPVSMKEDEKGETDFTVRFNAPQND